MPLDLNIFKPFLHSLTRDERITVWHMGVVFGILQLATTNASGPIFISRKLVMQLGHIKNIVTYHKCIKELQSFGYIEYFPSYHPGIRTRVHLLKKWFYALSFHLHFVYLLRYGNAIVFRHDVKLWCRQKAFDNANSVLKKDNLDQLRHSWRWLKL